MWGSVIAHMFESEMMAADDERFRVSLEEVTPLQAADATKKREAKKREDVQYKRDLSIAEASRSDVTVRNTILF